VVKNPKFIASPASVLVEPVDARNWIDLRIGERCTVSGKLTSVGYGSPGTLLLEFTDWSTLVIECDRPRDTKPIELSSQVHVRAERTEDGLKAVAIWTEGSVPIPLMVRC
jgi:hypothetical protein